MKKAKKKHTINAPLTDQSELVPTETIRKNLLEFIQKERPDFNDTDSISAPELKAFRRGYLEKMIEEEKGQLSLVERQVIDAITNPATVADDVLDNSNKLPYGQWLADKIAEFGGSWAFIILFAVILMAWIVFNSMLFKNSAFDKYPYILLNLILSCLAALQAPVIMMSQNRQAIKDRQRSEYDYKVNLKAEIEIRLLHDKLDHLMIHQTQKIFEMQQMQMDMFEDMVKKKKQSRTSEIKSKKTCRKRM